MQTPWGECAVADAHIHFFSRRFFAALAAQSGKPADTVAETLGWELPPADPAELARRWADELEVEGVSRAALIASMLQQGATPAQAAQGAATKLAARGVPVTPDVQAQLDYAAANPAATGITSPTTLLLGLGAVVLIAFVARR